MVPRVLDMRHLLLVVTLAGFAAASAPSDEGVRIRYTDPTSRIWLEVDHDISVREHKSIATRTLFFDLTVSTQGATPEVGVTVQEAGGTYTAHGMEQRLRARHLTGRQFAMSIGDQGSTMTADEPSDSPVIHPGPPVSRGIPIAETLAEILPILPPDPVLEGTTWTTERTIHAL